MTLINKTSRAAAFTVMVAISFATGSAVAAGLRSIRGQFNRKEYTRAENNLLEEIPGMKGKTLDQAKLLLASLSTDAGRASTILSEVMRTGDGRESLKARLELAKIHYSSGEYYAALGLLEGIGAEGRDSENYEAVYFRGLSRMQLGDLNGARRDFEGIDRTDWLHWSTIALGEIEVRDGKVREAIGRYETIAAAYCSPIAGFSLGECYEMTGEKKKALETFALVARNFPESPEAPKAREKVHMIDEPARRTGSDSRVEGGEGGTVRQSPGKPSSSGSPGYTLQFGAFSEKENARSFVDDLSPMIEGLHIETAEGVGTVWYRVRAGRFATREEAEEAALKLMERTGYSSKVLPLE